MEFNKYKLYCTTDKDIIKDLNKHIEKLEEIINNLKCCENCHEKQNKHGECEYDNRMIVSEDYRCINYSHWWSKDNLT